MGVWFPRGVDFLTPLEACELFYLLHEPSN